jgi:hypothetical protein
MSKYHLEKSKPDLWEQLKKENFVGKRLLTTRTMDKLIKQYEDQGGGYCQAPTDKPSQQQLTLKHPPY